MISVVSVKLTTARRLAEHVVDLTVRHLQRQAGPCVTARSQELPSACLTTPEQDALLAPANWPPAILERTVTTAVEREMAMTLSDFLFRRTVIGHKGYPGIQVVHHIGEIMAKPLGWSGDQLTTQIEAVEGEYIRMGVSVTSPVP